MACVAIFWGSDRGKEVLKSIYPDMYPSIHHIPPPPPIMISTMVQCINQPVVRTSVTLQNSDYGILKTVQKYYAAILVKGLHERFISVAIL